MHSLTAAQTPWSGAVAYLVNQYPKVSHSFIRREIEALERQGLKVDRFALRGWNEPVVDAADLRERSITRFLLQQGWTALLGALFAVALTMPKAWAAAFVRATRMGGRGATRPVWVHWIYLAEACLLARWMQRSGARHLHAHFGTNATEVAMLVHTLLGTPYSFTVHGPEEFDQPLALGLLEKARHASFVVAISSFGRSQLYRWLGPADWHKVKVVHCGLDPAFFTEPITPPSPAARLVCVGRLCEQKGQLLLLRAMRRVIDTGRSFELVLAGDGEMRAAIEALIDELGLGGQVRITGWISGEVVRAELQAARALVLPSFAEGLPVVLMEAMALGRPVLSTYVAGIPELVLDGECGWLFPAGDIDRLAAAIAACLDADADRLAAMGRAGRERCASRHAIDDQATLLAELLHRFREG